MSSSITWQVLKTRPRAEKKAAQQLTLLGAQVYCPIITRVSQWSDRKKLIDHPALPSMILIKNKIFHYFYLGYKRQKLIE